MVQPRHRHNPIPLTRWTRMLTAPSPDWNVFQQIFADHWEVFQQAHPRYQTAYYDDLVAKMLACGNPATMGYVEYRCLHCGQGTHRVSMSCKSALCLRCASCSSAFHSRAAQPSRRPRASCDGTGRRPRGGRSMLQPRLTIQVRPLAAGCTSSSGYQTYGLTREQAGLQIAGGTVADR